MLCCSSNVLASLTDSQRAPSRFWGPLKTISPLSNRIRYSSIRFEFPHTRTVYLASVVPPTKRSSLCDRTSVCCCVSLMRGRAFVFRFRGLWRHNSNYSDHVTVSFILFYNMYINLCKAKKKLRQHREKRPYSSKCWKNAFWAADYGGSTEILKPH